MFLKQHVNELVNLNAAGLSIIVRQSGYKDAKFDTCEFVGITNSGEFAYKASYYEDGGYDFTKLYVRRDDAGNYIADY
jgi:hypothetical protein